MDDIAESFAIDIGRGVKGVLPQPWDVHVKFYALLVSGSPLALPKRRKKIPLSWKVFVSLSSSHIPWNPIVNNNVFSIWANICPDMNILNLRWPHKRGMFCATHASYSIESNQNSEVSNGIVNCHRTLMPEVRIKLPDVEGTLHSNLISTSGNS